MKKLILMMSFALFGLMFLSSCSDDTFCIENFTFEVSDAAYGPNEITLPTGEIHTGNGLLPLPIQVGEYDMFLESVVTSTTVTETGAISEAIHFFYDNNGNSFWSTSLATYTNTGELGMATSIHTIQIIDGAGDFECASGTLIADVFGDFIENKIDFSLTGKICGGCK